MLPRNRYDIPTHENNKLLSPEEWAKRAVEAGNPRLSLAMRGVSGWRGDVADPYTVAVSKAAGWWMPNSNA